MRDFIHRPIARFLRHNLLLMRILGDTPTGHEDLETMPVVLDVIKKLIKEAEPGVVSAEQKVELWKYNANLVLEAGEHIVCLFVKTHVQR